MPTIAAALVAPALQNHILKGSSDARPLVRLQRGRAPSGREDPDDASAYDASLAGGAAYVTNSGREQGRTCDAAKSKFRQMTRQARCEGGGGAADLSTFKGDEQLGTYKEQPQAAAERADVGADVLSTYNAAGSASSSAALSAAATPRAAAASASMEATFTSTAADGNMDATFAPNGSSRI